tara:strand:+ start:380 stop:1159 length:780 start_codon:yes stop_codon:yes gene_type:complete
MVTSSMVISPIPKKISWARDADSNSVAIVDFDDAPTTELSINSDIVVEHYDQQPLDFLVDERAVMFPYLLLSSERIELWPYLIPSYLDDQSAVSEWVSEFWRAGQARVETFGLLDRLNRSIASSFTYEARDEVGVKRPKQTLSSRKGSCRDFATLMIEACRFLGLPARFVSGYATTEDIPAAMGATHAWTEVFLPGAGWKGFDSTGGVLTGPNHIAVAVGRDPESYSPIAGAFGSEDPKVSSKLAVQVSVTRVDAPSKV